jgi:hypothetical protein
MLGKLTMFTLLWLAAAAAHAEVYSCAVNGCVAKSMDPRSERYQCGPKYAAVTHFTVETQDSEPLQNYGIASFGIKVWLMNRDNDIVYYWNGQSDRHLAAFSRLPGFNYLSVTSATPTWLAPGEIASFDASCE